MKTVKGSLRTLEQQASQISLPLYKVREKRPETDKEIAPVHWACAPQIIHNVLNTPVNFHSDNAREEGF